MKIYVVGFYFNIGDFNKVVLIEKKRPEWQAGKLNGIGGHIEKGEQPIDAMIREFYEETGVKIGEDFWVEFAEISNDDWKVFFFYSFGDITACKSTTDEKLVIVDVADLSKLDVIPNLRWLIPMCLDDQHLYCNAIAQN